MNFNFKKLATLAVLSAMPVIANAGYMAYYPLEVKLGGTLPDGSIVIGDGSGQPTNPTEPTEPESTSKCVYDSGSKLIALKIDNAPFVAGDIVIMYAGKFIGAQSPSNGLSVPAGITNGTVMSNTAQMMEAEICGDNLSGYPAIPIPTGTPIEENSSAVSFSDTITSNYCPDARANYLGSCYVSGSLVSQNLSLQLDDTYGITVYTNSFSSADKANIDSATTISTSTGKSCSIDRRNSSSVGCYNKTLILESDFGSTITFTIK
ncbi:TPA: hypothetical protein ACJXXT_000260 [Pseudomonas aeruginosa]